MSAAPRAARGACASVSSARSSAHPAPLKLRIQATLDFRVNSAPSQLQRSASACQGQRRVERWRGVCSGEWGLRLLCFEDGAESANGDHEASSGTQSPASITALVPIDATDSPCGIILRRNRCRASAPAPEAAGLAAPRDGCAAAALLAARSDRLVARLHRSRIVLMRIRC